ncbi:MAG: methionine--tRNA ligase [Planctomycetes bacterium]|nr:methionine--tRNA ligase [Planctomycetota bacterium]
MSQRRILVTAALPYANGPIHIGHLVEYIQTDIWVRFQKLRGHRCIYICADDTHGTAIMKSARQRGCSEEEFIAEMSEAHQRDFAGFDIEFDNYGSTHSSENRELCQQFWQAQKEKNLLSTRTVVELFDADTGESLPDRFVHGTCPNPDCGAPDQYGDNCEVCGHTYSAVEVIDPISTVSGKPPVKGEQDHFFINIEALHDFLDEWTQSGEHLQNEVANYLKGHFLNAPLRDWDVSRPAPYFGFDIPGTDGKQFWYVWFDAPIGYMASTKQWCERHGENFDDWWGDSDNEVHHFIGKDIQYFHCLFWPAMLKTAGFHLPTRVHIHGFLTVDGKKMSKRDGTFVMAATYLRHLNPSYLRYYYASKLGPRVEDIDMNLDEFVSRVRSDLVGKIVNLASRSAKFVQQTGLSASYPDDGGLFEQGALAGETIATAYENCDYNRAMRAILELADRANPYVEAAKPWNLAKDPDKAQQLQDVCTVALNLFRQIVVYLSPVLPRLAEQTRELLGEPIEHWDQSQTPLVGTSVEKFKHMLKRADPKDVEKMIEESKDEATNEAPATTTFQDSDEPLKAEPLAEECTFQDFVKVDLRVARVVEAEYVEGADRLLKLVLSLGGDVRRTVFAGIKQAYEPDQLVGRLVIMAANLAPRKMKFGISEGMILASGTGGKDVFMLGVDDGGQVGQRVH